MQQELKAFKDPRLARGLIESIQALAPKSATLMEVCGTHTVAIARNGIRGLMPEGVRLASGPGCPVCVTSNHDIDKVIALARVPEVTIATFGDMTRVPGLHVQLAGRAGGGALGGDRLLAAGRPASGAGEPRSANRLRRRGLRNHHAARSYGHQTSARHGPCELHRIRRPQEHARGAGGHHQRPGAEAGRAHSAGARVHYHRRGALSLPGREVRHPRQLSPGSSRWTCCRASP